MVACGRSSPHGADTACVPETEIPYDGIDQNCDGADLVDVDQDGQPSTLAGGADCDDNNIHISPDASDIVGDGTDQNCDGIDGTDTDGDGWASQASGGTDCDDTDPVLNPGDEDEDGTTSCDGDCDDGDPGTLPGAPEVPYDGVDQDCDGSDLTDVDGDGYDAEAVGGGDCDDEDASVNPVARDIAGDGIDNDCDGVFAKTADHDGDGHDAVEEGGDDCDDTNPLVSPSAREVPYDGIDNDCDGTDLTDVDGDGYDGERAGGDDCDDLASSTNPDASETASDGADNDCDGTTDEITVCPDGSGVHTTVQGAVDAAVDGDSLELCPATWSENISIANLDLTIYGGGEHPNDVIFNGTGGGNAIAISGDSSDLTLRWLTMGGPIDVEEISSFTLEYVDLCEVSGSELRTNLIVEADVIVLSRSRICSEDVFLMGDSAVVEGNLFSSGAGEMILYGKNADIHNNIFYDGYVLLHFYISTAPLIKIENNHFASLSLLGFSYSNSAFAESVGYPEIYYYSNIFYDVDLSATGVWQYKVYSDYPCCLGVNDISDIAPTGFSSNIVYDNVGFKTKTEWYEYQDVVATDTGLAAELLSASILADPDFMTDTGMGSYALSPTSPGIDAGAGDPDPDGTPNDIGAFGGPEGDWWKEVPWVLP